MRAMSTATTTIPPRPADADAIAEAARLLRRGELVAFPTETVYGLGANAEDGDAVARLFEAKGRPRINPLIVHVGDPSQAEQCGEFIEPARKLAVRFWPGPLTIVVARKPKAKISILVSAGLDTIALRVPAHPVAAALLRSAGIPIAAPSANISGHVTATAAAHVAAELGGRVGFILDGGPATFGLESTIIGFEADRAVLLRPGSIPREEIEGVTGPLKTFEDTKIRSPGQLTSHYAPRARLRLNAGSVREGEALLAFGPTVPFGASRTLNLSPSGELREAATNLFAMLRALDSAGARTIAVMPVPATGLGEAINDRLTRAAAPKGSPT